MGQSTKSLANLLAALCLIVAVALLGASTFFGAQFNQIQSSLQNDSPNEQAAADALDRMKTRLGPGGFLFHFSEFIRTGQSESLVAMRSALAGAESALREFESLPQKTSAASLIFDIRNTLGLYQNTLKSAESLGSSSIPSDFAASRGMTLTTAYATLGSTLAAYQQDSFAARLDKLVDTASFTQTVTLVATAILLVLAVTVSWFTRSRVLNPLIEMENSVFNLAEGDIHHTVWGIHRQDEIGALARAIDRVRTQVAQPSQTIASPVQLPDAAKLMAMEARYAPLFEKALSILAQASDTMKARAEEMGKMVDSTQAELTTAVIHVGDTCSSVAQTSHDMQEILHLAASAMISVKEHMEESGLTVSNRLEHIVGRLQGQTDSINNQTTALARASMDLDEAKNFIESVGKALSASERQVRDVTQTLGAAAYQVDETSDRLLQIAQAAPPKEVMDALNNAAYQAPQQQAANVNRDEDIRRALSDAVAILAGKLQAMMNQINDLRLAQGRGINPNMPPREPSSPSIVQAFPSIANTPS